MVRWWLVVGSPRNWRTAFEHGSIWGLKATPRQEALWKSICKGDRLLFYATRPVSGVIGHGVVRTKFKQDKPLWPQEVIEGGVIWPNRFEFDVKYCLEQENWETGRVPLTEISPRSGFQGVKAEIAREIVRRFPELPPRGSLHDDIKRKLVEIGQLQKMIAEAEYKMDGARLDVVWRRVERGVPTYVFEVQVGGDVFHALGKLKHAHDLWNSNIFLIATEGDLEKAHKLLSGTFHEIKNKMKVIEIEKIEELLRRKKAFYELETELGIW